MNVWRIVSREIAHRKLSFVLGWLSVTLASACVVASVTLLNVYDLNTAALLSSKQSELSAQLTEMKQQIAARGKELEDEMRKITLKMGFNIVIMPKGQNLTDLFADDYASKFMDESLAKKLADSDIVTINHLLPSLEQKIQWAERNNRTMILIGIQGEVPLAHRDPKKPLLDPVPAGEIIMGNELARTEEIQVGDTVTLLGEEFSVSNIYPPRGDKRDVTAWIDLKQSQRMLDKPQLINSIWALECKCAFADLPKVREEIEKILPDTTVMEKNTIALARAEARQKAEQDAKAALLQAENDAENTLAQEEQGRLALKGQRESLIALAVPLAIVLCSLWIAFLTLSNVQQRRVEIGVWRAIGLRTSQILTIFMTKAAIWGILGAVAGVLAGATAGLACGAMLEGLDLREAWTQAPFEPSVVALVVIVAPLVSMLASWLPALSAAQQDPAIVLCEE